MATDTVTTSVRNRWVIVVAAIVMQLALGAIYAWSVFVKPLEKAHGWNDTQVTLTFTIAIFMLGIGATIGGFLMDRYGPRFVGTLAGVCYGLGVLCAGFSGDSLFVLYLTYGIFGGLGMGLGYIVPVATLVKWFPDRRGLVTGLAVCGFGGGALLLAPIATALIKSAGVGNTFIIVGIAYLIMVLIAAQFYADPPAGYVPAGWTPTAKQTSQRAARDFTPGQALTRWQWYALWGILALNVSAGIMLISQASPMAQDITGVSVTVAAGLVSAISIFNFLGRVSWAWLSDLIGRRQVFMTMFGLQVVLFLLLAITSNFIFFSVLAVIVALCYGGGFGTMPAFTADYFGARKAGSIYGVMLTAWGVGGIIGPILIARVKDLTGNYTAALYIIAAIMLVSFLLPFFTRPPRVQEEAEASVVGGVQPQAGD
jgi:OFA family oxalate/formate antiporter-like MFS transporter